MVDIALLLSDLLDNNNPTDASVAVTAAAPVTAPPFSLELDNPILLSTGGPEGDIEDD